MNLDSQTIADNMQNINIQKVQAEVVSRASERLHTTQKVKIQASANSGGVLYDWVSI